MMCSMDFEYKKYSLEQLENWIHDSLSTGDATPQEIYDVIKNTVSENYYVYKNHTERCYELLALLNGNGKGHISAYDEYVEKKENLVCDKDSSSEECKKSWNDFWEEHYYPEEYKGSTVSSVDDCMRPWGHSDMEALRYTEEELNAMCEKAELDEKLKKETKVDGYSVNGLTFDELEEIKNAGGYEWTPDPIISRNDPNRLKFEDGWIYESPDGGKTVTKRKVGSTEKIVVKEDKVKKWVLPVEEVKDEDTDENIYCVTFPDDLLDAADLKEGDQVEWVDKGDGSYLLRKVNRPLLMDEF